METTKEINKQLQIMAKNRTLLESIDPELLYSREVNSKKIDIFVDGKYFCSTNMSKSCKLAKARLLNARPMTLICKVIKAQFSK